MKKIMLMLLFFSPLAHAMQYPPNGPTLHGDAFLKLAEWLRSRMANQNSSDEDKQKLHKNERRKRKNIHRSLKAAVYQNDTLQEITLIIPPQYTVHIITSMEPHCPKNETKDQ